MRSLLLGVPFVFLVSLGAYAQPIASFEDPADLALFSPNGVHIQRVADHASDGQYSLRLAVKGAAQDTWPGVNLKLASMDLSGYAVLSYDVYNSEQYVVPMAFAIGDEAGKREFLFKSLAPQTTTTFDIWLASYRYTMDLKHITQLYPYFSKPRKDAVLYLDNFRFQAMKARFHAVVWEDTAPDPRVSPVDRTRGYVVFTRPWAATVFPQSRPLESERTTALRAFGCPGETVPVKVSLWSLEDLGATRIVAEDLRLGNKTVPAEAVKAYPVRCLDKRVYYSSDYFVKDMPALLEERPAVDIAAGRAQSFWVEVALPANAAPGLYEGRLLVKPTNGEASSLRLAVRVLPYRLAAAPGMYWGVYYTGPKFVKTPEEVKSALERDLADQRAHGMTSVGLCFGLEKEDFSVANGQVTIAPQPEGRYARFMETYKRLGFPRPVIQLNDTGQAAAAGEAVYSEGWKKLYKEFWIALARYHRERGWPQVIVQPVDEPGWQGPDERERNEVCLKLLKEIPGQLTEQDGPGDNYFLTVAGPYADVWNFNGAVAEPKALADILKRGKTVLTYNNDVEGYRPEMQRYCNGFYQLRAGIQGAFNWEYMGFNGNPYDDQDAPSDSWLTRYPAMPELGEVGGSSTGWAGARAGVDDYRYAQTLKEAINRGLKSSRKKARLAAQNAQSVLPHVLATLDYRPGTRATAAWASEKPTAEGGKSVTGQLKVPNGWDLDTYDRARWQLVSATMDILAALGEVAPLPRGSVTRAQSTDLLQNVQWTNTETSTAAPVVGGSGKHVNIPLVDTPPNCDGELSDAAWQQASRLGPFTLSDGSRPPSQQTDVRLCADRDYLYFGVECAEENIEHLTARVGRDGGPVWEDDCVELFFDPSLDRSSFRQLCFNSLGKVYWNSPADRGWKPEVRRGARVDQEHKRWFLEVGVPLSSLNLAGTTFGLNVCRERRPLESLELSCWSPTLGGFGNAQRFGTASLGGSLLAGYRLGRGVVGHNELSVDLANHEAGARKVTAVLNWRQAGGVALYRQSGPVALAPGQKQTLTLGYEVGSDRVPVDFDLLLKDAESGQVLEQRRSRQQVLPVGVLTVDPHLYYLSENAGALTARLNLAPEARERAAVIVQLLPEKGAKALRSLTLRQVAGDQLHATLNLAGLKPGTYRLEMVVKASAAPEARRLGTAKTNLTRVQGPFD